VSGIFQGFGQVLVEVLSALTPLAIALAVFQPLFLKLPREALANVIKGMVLTLVGLALFLQGVYVGFLPVGREMGQVLGASAHRWSLLPIGFVLGFVATLAEPAVRVLSNEVERASSGQVNRRVIQYTLSLGVGAFVCLAMARTVYGTPIHYIVVPGYLLAVGMLGFSDSTFTSIAFDAGGVATGPMTVTLVMALAVGAATSMKGRDAVTDGFGLIALVALAPILSIMLLGLLYQRRKGGIDNEP
jgi:hypothetical protein